MIMFVPSSVAQMLPSLIDANGVREGEAVEILSDLLDERAVGAELEQLRRRLAVERAARAGAAEDVEVSARIHRDARDFAEGTRSAAA